jgi:hypothetical protein
MTTKINTTVAITEKSNHLMSMNNDMRNLIFSIAHHTDFMSQFKKSVLSIIAKHDVDTSSDDPTLDDAINTNSWAYVRYLFENFDVAHFEGSGYGYEITLDDNRTSYCRSLQMVFSNDELLSFEFEWESSEYEEFLTSVCSLEINDSDAFDQEDSTYEDILSALMNEPCVQETLDADFVSITSDYNIKLRPLIEDMLRLIPS